MLFEGKMFMFNVVIKVCDRKELADEVQHVLTDYGKDIILRFGMPVPNNNNNCGIINLIHSGNDFNKMIDKLDEIDGISVKYVEI